MIFLTYKKQTGMLTGFIEDKGVVPTEPFILISEARYTYIIKEPRKYKVINGELKHFPDSASDAARVKALHRIATQRREVSKLIQKGIIHEGYSYGSSITDQLNYNTALLLNEPLEVWRHSISENEWFFVSLGPSEVRTIVKAIQVRRVALSEVSHQDAPILAEVVASST